MNFLCARCKQAMCPDCLSIADEYQTLLGNNRRYLAAADDRIRDLQDQLKLALGSRKDWERLAKLGYPEVITRWMDQEITKCRG